jgi:hypothetical protein
MARSSSSLDGPDPARYLYLDPTQRQRLKYNMLEERRLAQFKETLTSNGWATSGVPKALAKAPLHPENKDSLTDEERACVEQQFAAIKALSQQKAEVRAALVAAVKEEQEKESTVDGAVRSQDMLRRQQRRDGRSGAFSSLDGSDALDQQQRAVNADYYLMASPSPAVSAKPAAVFRPELPLSKMPSKEVLESIAPFLDPPKSLVAPPWGRQTALDDRWERVRVFDSRSKSKKFETIGKLEVDHELRVVRDAGLLRRERQTLLKTLDPKTLEIVRSLPADYGRVQKGSKAMKPPVALGAATL